MVASISSDTFDAPAYHDEYQQRLIGLIEEKSKGNIVTLVPKEAPAATDVVDLMQRLKESVAQSLQKKRARSRALPAQVAHLPEKKANTGKR